MKILSLAFLALIAPIATLAQDYPNQYGWGMMGGNYSPLGWGVFGAGMIVMIIFWGLVLYALVRLVQWLSVGTSSHYSARRILDERFAKGEISAEEYAERKKTLAGK